MMQNLPLLPHATPYNLTSNNHKNAGNLHPTDGDEIILCLNTEYEVYN